MSPDRTCRSTVLVGVFGGANPRDAGPCRQITETLVATDFAGDRRFLTAALVHLLGNEPGWGHCDECHHAARAVRMAVDMQAELVELRKILTEAAMVEISAGIGISTGFVTVGNCGSANRMDYTVMGNHVNLASRLADEAGPGDTLISERTLALLPAGLVTVEPAGERNLKGVQRPIALFRIV